MLHAIKRIIRNAIVVMELQSPNMFTFGKMNALIIAQWDSMKHIKILQIIKISKLRHLLVITANRLVKHVEIMQLIV